VNVSREVMRKVGRRRWVELMSDETANERRDSKCNEQGVQPMSKSLDRQKLGKTAVKFLTKTHILLP